MLRVLCVAVGVGCVIGCEASCEGEGDVGEGDVGEGEGDVGEGEGEGEGEGDVGRGFDVVVQLTWAGGDAGLFAVEAEDAVFCVDDERAAIGAPLVACAEHPELVVAPFGPLTADWGIAGVEQDPQINGGGFLSLSVEVGSGAYLFGVETQGAFATLKLFIDGALEGEWADNVGDLDAAYFVLEVSADRVCVEDLRDGDASDNCP